jgi:hypothetical protein
VVPGQDEHVIRRTALQVTHLLPYGIGSALVPFVCGQRLFGGQNLDIAAGKGVKLVGSLNVPVQ